MAHVRSYVRSGKRGPVQVSEHNRMTRSGSGRTGNPLGRIRKSIGALHRKRNLFIGASDIARHSGLSLRRVSRALTGLRPSKSQSWPFTSRGISGRRDSGIWSYSPAKRR